MCVWQRLVDRLIGYFCVPSPLVGSGPITCLCVGLYITLPPCLTVRSTVLVWGIQGHVRIQFTVFKITLHRMEMWQKPSQVLRVLEKSLQKMWEWTSSFLTGVTICLVLSVLSSILGYSIWVVCPGRMLYYKKPNSQVSRTLSANTLSKGSVAWRRNARFVT